MELHAKLVRSQLNFFKPLAENCSLELTRKGSSKGGMVQYLARRLGIDAQHIYCVGDNQNDIPMLELSAIPFAPANCAQEVKDWGAHILCHCDDGVIGDIVEILEQRY